MFFRQTLAQGAVLDTAVSSKFNSTHHTLDDIEWRFGVTPPAQQVLDPRLPHLLVFPAFTQVADADLDLS